MRTVKDLGRVTKLKYPDYRDVDDVELGRAIKKKYPGSYDDFVDVIGTEIEHLGQKYRTDRGRVSSWWERGKSVQRTQLFESLNTETTALLEALKLRVTKATIEYELDHLDERLVLDDELHRSTVINQIVELRAASEQGLGLDTYRHIRLLQAEVDVERARMQLEVERYHEMKLIDVQVEGLMAALDARMADLKNLMPYHELDLLHEQLSGIHRAYIELEQSAEGEYKVRELNRLQSKMETWEQDINGRQTRLLQGAPGEDS